MKRKIPPGKQAGFFRVFLFLLFYEPLDAHFEVVFFTKRGDFLHHFRFVVNVERRLVAPAVNQQHGLRVVHREKVRIAFVPLLRTHGIHKAGLNHFFCEFFGVVIFAGIVNVNGDGHKKPPFISLNTMSV